MVNKRHIILLQQLKTEHVAALEQMFSSNRINYEILYSAQAVVIVGSNDVLRLAKQQIEALGLTVK